MLAPYLTIYSWLYDGLTAFSTIGPLGFWLVWMVLDSSFLVLRDFRVMDVIKFHVVGGIWGRFWGSKEWWFFLLRFCLFLSVRRLWFLRRCFHSRRAWEIDFYL